eukprot:GEMP01031207.1.p1 GENE.GEMP01031207.1~~GEMP01031207.1.p1  ORF type:complete len:308 (+),score=51.56 GEMP01031207.1:119-925(+)
MFPQAHLNKSNHVSGTIRSAMAHSARPSGEMPPKTSGEVRSARSFQSGAPPPSSRNAFDSRSGRSRTSSQSGRLSSRGRNSSQYRSLPPNEVDHSSILEVSQETTNELDFKTREKQGLLRLQQELKKRQQFIDAKYSKLKAEVDKTLCQVMVAEERSAAIISSNISQQQEVEGLTRENEKRKEETEMLAEAVNIITNQLAREKKNAEGLSRIKAGCRKEMQLETKCRETSLHNLRASKTAHSLLLRRLEETQKQSLTLRRAVSSTVGN